MVRTPAVMPAQPHPCIARPTINVVEVGARAQMMEPARKSAMDAQNVAFKRMV
jgi:hypothetical protein